MNLITELQTVEEFETKVLQSTKISVVDFWAEWCGPCRMVGPEVEKLAEANEDIQVGKVNVDENGTTAASFGIRSIPTIMFFKDGEKIQQISGARQMAELQKIVDGLKEE